jgi:hypothetical protein
MRRSVPSGISVRLFWVVIACLWWSSQSACIPNACVNYFQQLKQRCRINLGGGTSPEGSKLDEFMNRPFTPCQLEVCLRAAVSDIDCRDPETHIPGGMNGRFETCVEPLSN